MTLRVLIVDDEPHIADSIELLLRDCEEFDLELHKAYRVQQALGFIQQTRIDLLITDIQMPGMTGLELIRKTKALWPKCVFVILSAYSEFEYAKDAINQQVAAYLLKTEEESAILTCLQQILTTISNNLCHKEWLSLRTPKEGSAVAQSLLLKLLFDNNSNTEQTQKVLSQIGFSANDSPLIPSLVLCRKGACILYPILLQALSCYLDGTKASIVPVALDTDKVFILSNKLSTETLIGSFEAVQAAYFATCQQDISFIVGHPWESGEQFCLMRKSFLRKSTEMQDSFIPCVVEKDKSNSVGQITVTYLKNYIHSHIREDLSLTYLAQITGYNASYLSRIFSSETNETLVRYIARKRMTAIQELMMDPSLTLDQIMKISNFASRSYFNCFVKRETGLSPKKYRLLLTTSQK